MPATERLRLGRIALLGSALAVACDGEPVSLPDGGPADTGAVCETQTLSAPLTLTSTSGAQLMFPRLEPNTGQVLALLVVDSAPRDIVVLDDAGAISRRLGFGAELRSVPTDFALARHAPLIVFSAPGGLSMRTIDPGPVQVIVPGRVGIEPELSPDGRRLVFRENTRLYSVALSDTGEALGEPEEIVLTQGVGAMRPRHSPSGGELAYFMAGVVEIYDFGRAERRTVTSVVGQAHVAWLDAERLVIADDRGLSIVRGNCREAERALGPARQVDAAPSSGRLVFKPVGSPGLGLIELSAP